MSQKRHSWRLGTFKAGSRLAMTLRVHGFGRDVHFRAVIDDAACGSCPCVRRKGLGKKVKRSNRSPLASIFTVSFSSFTWSPEQTRSRLHHFQRRDRFRRGGPQVPEPAYARQKSRFKGSHRLVERIDRSRQGSPQGLEMIPENRSALVDLLSEVADLTRALGELLLPPPIGH